MNVGMAPPRWCTVLRYHDPHHQLSRLISLFKCARNRVVSDPPLHTSLIKAYNNLAHTIGPKKVHARVVKLGLATDVHVTNSLIHSYMSSKSSMRHACQMFNESPVRTVVTLNTLVHGFLKNGELVLAFGFFKKLLSCSFGNAVKPNFVTLVVLVSGLVGFKGYDCSVGSFLHCYCLKAGLDSWVEVGNVFIDFYAKFGCLNDAERLFSEMVERDLVTWNTMMVGYARSDKWRNALCLFGEMRFGVIGFDRVSLINLVLACCKGGEAWMGKVIHGYLVVSGNMFHVSIGPVLINMYSKCRLVEFARKIFDQLLDMDVASYNSMIHGYVGSGQDIEALELFNLMKAKKLMPDEVTMLGLIAACRNSGDLSRGTEIHSYIERSDHLHGRIILQNSLVDMYAKCGNMAQAKMVFHKMAEKDVVSWTSLIVGHALNGEGEEALLTFQQMCREKVEPNLVTFIGVLLACDHSGLVDAGKSLYDTMCKVYDIEPNIAHLGCMVDMLARGGMLEEAINFVKKMPLESNTIVQRMLINACRIHGKVDLGINLVGDLIDEKISPNAENRIISSNVLAEAGRWDDVLHTRCSMIARKTPKMAGKSCVADFAD